MLIPLSSIIALCEIDLGPAGITKMIDKTQLFHFAERVIKIEGPLPRPALSDFLQLPSLGAARRPPTAFWPPPGPAEPPASLYMYKLPINRTAAIMLIAGWEEERSGPTGKSFRFVRACVRAVIVKWK